MAPLGRFAVALLAVVVLALLPRGNARAHAMKTAYLELQEGAPGIATAMWRTPVAGDEVVPRLPGCAADDAPALTSEGRASRFVHHLTFRCPTGIAGREILVTGLGVTVSEAVVRVSLADGKVASQVLSASHAAWTVPAKHDAIRVFGRYVRIGVEHIVQGADHLLFVLGLVLLIGARRIRDILWTATSFTVAHSVTLTATAMGWMRIPPLVAETCIAATLVLLALDIGTSDRAKQPRITAFVFGLVHGLGFAGALAEIGLPEDAMVPALFAFNVGVELGQLLFIATVLAVLAGIARTERRWPRVARAPALVGAYAIGTMGMVWLLQRGQALLAS